MDKKVIGSGGTEMEWGNIVKTTIGIGLLGGFLGVIGSIPFQGIISPWNAFLVTSITIGMMAFIISYFGELESEQIRKNLET